MSSLATIRADVQIDLHDSGASIWTTAVLDRHIKRALREYSMVTPLEEKTTLTTASNSRTVDVSSLAPRIRIVAAEYPTGEYPPEFTPFTLWEDGLTLDLQTAPAGTPNVDVYWHEPHTINGTVSFPATDDDIIATGAAGFAALDTAVFAVNRVNQGGDAVWGRYTEFGQERLKQFREQLRALPVSGLVRSGRLYAPALERLRSQTTDPGPL